ncbi:protein C2-DOMAIN ABA-RELATED 4-like [Primulina huaijiensis]|uniref:protein C2-DOMAIN ABA-RELATED 4-like n=1 Tax=Primulina huaijiensis TaxID=1492673 RepID=UPI003CC70642
MENILGLLRIRVIRGINLPERDIRSCYPYVVITLGKQKVMTGAVKKNANPEWNEELTLLIADIPNIPIILRVYDRHKVSRDGEIGDAEFDIRPFLESIAMHLDNVIDGTVITTMKPNIENCLAEESYISLENGQVVQHMFLRLRNVECGEVELKLHWIDGSSSRNAV